MRLGTHVLLETQMGRFEFTESEIESVCNELEIPVTAFHDKKSERRLIIDRWDDANIVACPGSGKTTVLLAKLLLLSRRMPFDDGSGICVLTHTNVAIDEIKSKLRLDSDILLKHPNFFGTIQSFVNKFLANPAFNLHAGIKQANISRIDSDYAYSQKKNEYFNIGFGKDGNKTLCNYLYGQANRDAPKGTSSIKKNKNAIKFLASLKYDLLDNVIKRSNGKTLLKDPNKDNFIAIKELVYSLWEKGILSYEDAYNFANWYVVHCSSILQPIFAKRFKYLFVDEMQDTQQHQINIITSAFNDEVIKQYYGDPDQAIFNGSSESKMAWDYKKKSFSKLEITDSKRYGTAISQCIYPFRKEISKIVGMASWESHKPCILLYENPEDAIAMFHTEIQKRSLIEEVYYKNWNRESAPFNAVGFVGKKPESGNEKITINSYTNNFSKEIQKRRVVFNNLDSYFQKRPQEETHKEGTQIYYALFLNAFLELLDQNGIKETKRTLLKRLSETEEEFLNEYNLKVYSWIKDIEFEGKQPSEIKDEFIHFFQKHKLVFTKKQFTSNNIVLPQTEFKNKTNIFSKDGIDIKIGTIHSVKGETHMATLLLENQNDRKFESDYFFNDKSGCLFCNDKYTRPKSYKMLENRLKTTYVAMSRPTHLLCVAMSKERVKCTVCSIEQRKKCMWKIIE